MPNRRPFIQEQKHGHLNNEEQPSKLAAGCAATGAAFVIVPLCALLVIGPLFILPMVRGTQSARPNTALDNVINQIMGSAPTPTLAGVPITLIKTTLTLTPNVSITPMPTAQPSPTTMIATATPSPAATPSPIPTVAPTAAPTIAPTATRGPLTTAKVAAVVNGDTIDVTIGTTRRRVRYLGISAPTGTQCYAANATTLNRQLVTGQTVTLEQSTTNTDSAGNLLRLVYLSNNKLINEELLSKGAARIQPASLNTTLTERLTTAQKNAVNARAGLWSACAQTRP